MSIVKEYIYCFKSNWVDEMPTRN